MNSHFGRLMVLALVVLSNSISASAAMILQGYDPAKHDRFANNGNFIGSGYDWAGVGRTGGAWGTLISPSFVVTASHLPAGGAIRFYQTNDPAGPYVERTVVQNFTLTQTGLNLPSDLTLGLLNAPATGVDFFPILDLPASSDYLNQTQFVFGLSNTADPYTSVRVGRNQVDEILPAFSDPALGNSKNDVFIYDYDNPGGLGADEAFLQGGDSGGPSFIIADGRPALVGIHWFIFGPGDFPGYDTGSGDTFVPSFIGALNLAMANAAAASEFPRSCRSLPRRCWRLPVSYWCFVSAGSRYRRRARQLIGHDDPIPIFLSCIFLSLSSVATARALSAPLQLHQKLVYNTSLLRGTALPAGTCRTSPVSMPRDFSLGG